MNGWGHRSSWLRSRCTKLSDPVYWDLFTGNAFATNWQKKHPYKRQKPVRINYEDMVLDDALRLDVLVDDLVVVEFKAQEIFNPVWQAQL